jgi:Uma2 family endonuclease
MSTIAEAPLEQKAEQTLPVFRFTLTEFHRLLKSGVLSNTNRLELVEGVLVRQMTHNPPHATAVDLAQGLLRPLLTPDWHLREQKPVTLTDSEPEPDVGVVRGTARRYARAHPQPKDIALLVEVADSTLAEDRTVKVRVYARARIPVYWIINLIDRCVEVYTQPRAGRNPAYRQRQVYSATDTVPVVIGGKEVGRLAVRDLLP